MKKIAAVVLTVILVFSLAACSSGGIEIAVIYDDVLKAEEWLRNNTWTTTIKKWDTDHWGEIPADFGRK